MGRIFCKIAIKKSSKKITVGVVPLVIKNYELRVKNGGVVNKWITLNEINVSHFNIQFSVDSKDFVKVGTIAAQNKAVNEYQFYHNPTPNPQHQIWFYRIEAIDKDGKKTYSKTEKIQLKIENEQLIIYPNPAKNIINISFPKIKQVSITDMAGRLILSKQIVNTNIVQLNIGILQKGVYILTAISIDEIKQTQKLVIE